jgi:hypothetical protein
VIYLIILGAIMLIGATTTFFMNLHCKRKYGLKIGEVSTFSWPAQRILEEYTKLPEANRPYANLTYILQAMDTKYLLKKVNDHFSSFPYYTEGTRVFKWDIHSVGSCPETCTFRPYRDLYDGIKSIREALAEQQHALAIAGVADGLSSAEQMLERLREESRMVREVTKELTAD